VLASETTDLPPEAELAFQPPPSLGDHI
jgi:hypothetical protein